jgi:Protein of unknown function (DUF1161)
MLKVTLTSMAFGLAGGAAVGQTCEAIQAAIEQKIRATGTADFNLTTVPAESTAAGKLVGSCDRGAKKILYTRVASAAGASEVAGRPSAQPLRPNPNRPKPAAPEPLLTECKDGSMSLGGDCKK